MKALLAQVWEQRDDSDLRNNDAIKKLSAVINEELLRESTENDIRDHIRRHYKNPRFVETGIPVSQWQQHAHGYYTMLYPGVKMVRVGYFKRDGKFLFAELTIGSSQQKPIPLTEPVDVWDFSYLEDR